MTANIERENALVCEDEAHEHPKRPWLAPTLEDVSMEILAAEPYIWCRVC